MILKIFNKETGKLDPIEFTTQYTYKNTDGSISKYYRKLNVEKSLNSKVDKSGDVMNGSLVFDIDCGIQGHYVDSDNLNYNDSKIQYVEDNNIGIFKVINKSASLDRPNNTTQKTFNLDIDSQPTQGSKNLVTSGDLYEILYQINQRLSALETSQNS